MSSQPVESVMVSPEARKGRNKLAVVVVIGHAVKHIYNSALQSILFPEIKAGLGLNATQIGTLAFSRQITGWGTTMGAGYLGDRFSNKASLMLALSMTLMGISYFVVGRAPNYWVMLAAMLLVGVGPSLFHPPAISALSRKFPDKRGFAISLHGTGGSLGEVLGPLIAAGLLTFLMWREVLQVSLFPALLAAFMLYAMMKGQTGEKSGTSSFRAYLASTWTLVKRKALLMLVIVTALRSMGQNGIAIFLPIYLREDLLFSPAKVALFIALSQVVGIVTQPIMGYFSDKLGRKVILVPSMTAMGLMFLALRWAEPGFQLNATIIALGAFLYSLHTIFIAAAMDVAKGEVQSTVVSLIYGASFFGSISLVVVGLVVDATNNTANAFVFGGVSILVATLVLALSKMPKTSNQLASSSSN